MTQPSPSPYLSVGPGVANAAGEAEKAEAVRNTVANTTITPCLLAFPSCMSLPFAHQSLRDSNAAVPIDTYDVGAYGQASRRVWEALELWGTCLASGAVSECSWRSRERRVPASWVLWSAKTPVESS